VVLLVEPDVFLMYNNLFIDVNKTDPEDTATTATQFDILNVNKKYVLVPFHSNQTAKTRRTPSNFPARKMENQFAL